MELKHRGFIISAPRSRIAECLIFTSWIHVWNSTESQPKYSNLSKEMEENSSDFELRHGGINMWSFKTKSSC
ncbi:unnamed protein product [Lathyrus oleraceus]